ncbi:hypothetical protein THRCLA_01311 [Thraustotheca clavata]|uniref:CBS domain-containing protein n=1 Tax=Thraustotheca clavata TaxID=74557 RepID=A0A1W0A917_9STRA|nr:hypothetical protein THRCLA_01311 [Thraustotheca clavata]
MLGSLLLSKASVRSSMNGLQRFYHYNKGTAKDMMTKSCYYGVNFVIQEDATVFEAITRMAGINLGCFAVSNENNQFVGVVSERDYLKKVELQGLTAKETLVSEIMTHKARLVHANENETPSQLMTKMLNSDIRHLPVVDANGDIIGMLSIKDIVRELNREEDILCSIKQIARLKRSGRMVKLERELVESSLSTLGKHPITNKHIYTMLTVQNQDIDNIDILREFPNLQTVNISDNQIESLASLAHLPFLLSLDASKNNMKTLLDFDTPQCTKNNAWVDGNQAIGSMLHYVNLSHNQLCTMRDLSRHRYIQELVLEHNDIVEISGISELTLRLAHNKIQCTKGLTPNLLIETIDLSNNQIDDASGLPRLGRLLHVNLSKNHLEDLDELGKCKMLQTLDASENRIRDLCHIDALTRLRNLSHLSLSNCPITRIPFYRYRILVRTQQVVMLDGLMASVKERIKANVLHGKDLPSRVQVFERYMEDNEPFVNYLAPLDMEYTPNDQMNHPRSGLTFNLTNMQSHRSIETDSAKNTATEAAAKAILVAQVKIASESFTQDLLNDMPTRYPSLFGCGTVFKRISMSHTLYE